MSLTDDGCSWEGRDSKRLRASQAQSRSNHGDETRQSCSLKMRPLKQWAPNLSGSSWGRRGDGVGTQDLVVSMPLDLRVLGEILQTQVLTDLLPSHSHHLPKMRGCITSSFEDLPCH